MTKVNILWFGSARVSASFLNYHGTKRLWMQLGENIEKININDNSEVWVCSGNDWYTFPSHFFLPSNVKLGFIKEDFGGQLPQYYDSINQNFNDKNKEVEDRYVSKEKCDWIVHTTTSLTNESILYEQIIDSENSPMETRSLCFSDCWNHNTYRYYVAQNNRLVID